MAVPARASRLKTAADLGIWLRNTVAPRLGETTQVAAHGGTALTLHGAKESTKDVDFSFRTREDFDRFRSALAGLGYVETADFRPSPREIYLRVESPPQTIDTVDVRFPTWNSWRLTDNVLKTAKIVPHGLLQLVLPDMEVVFLFKTYPLRDTDLDDLRATIDFAGLDQERIITLFREQDRIHRMDLNRETEHDPLINVLNLRVRFAASLHLLGKEYQKKVRRLVTFSQSLLRELSLRPSLDELAHTFRDPDRLEDWDRIVGNQASALRKRLLIPEPNPRIR